jgi:orotate phosphoribosyltransferase
MQYFSIANAGKSKYKPYFTNFLKFKSNDERQQFIDIASNDILIVDDVTTTGSTILEICRIIRNAGVDSKIIVFTVIGNSTLY